MECDTAKFLPLGTFVYFNIIIKLHFSNFVININSDVCTQICSKDDFCLIFASHSKALQLENFIRCVMKRTLISQMYLKCNLP